MKPLFIVNPDAHDSPWRWWDGGSGPIRVPFGPRVRAQAMGEARNVAEGIIV